MPSTCHAPVITIESPVRVQITIVSINVPVILTSPCLTGSLVCAAAAAIGALPRPASLEKMPLATPFCIATSILPTAPPVIALGENAASTIILNAAGTLVILAITKTATNNTYIIAINGTTT